MSRRKTVHANARRPGDSICTVTPVGWLTARPPGTVTDKDRQIHTRRQSLEHPGVGATLDDERDALARHFTATISECRPNGDSRRDRSRRRMGARPGHGR